MVSIVHGGLAQLVERLLRKQEVTGSNPVISTKNKDIRPKDGYPYFYMQRLRDSKGLGVNEAPGEPQSQTPPRPQTGRIP